MSIEDAMGYQHEGETCVVCGKALRPGEALVKMHQSGSKLPICCPLCLEAYQKDPKPYLECLARRTLLQEIHKPEDAPPGQSPLNE